LSAEESGSAVGLRSGSDVIVGENLFDDIAQSYRLGAACPLREIKMESTRIPEIRLLADLATHRFDGVSNLSATNGCT
jgi:hypothetical protein